MLVCPEECCPIYVVIDISQGVYLVKGHYMDEHAFLDVSGCTLCFPMYDVEALWIKWVTC